MLHRFQTVLHLVCRKIPASLLLACASLLSPAQTVIDLHSGKVRAKTTADYRSENADIAKRQAADSVAYNQCLTRGFNALYADSLAEAEKCFREALRLRPEAKGNYVVRRNLGSIALSRGNYGKAEELFTDVLKGTPSDTLSRLLRAKAFLGMGNALAALTDCRVLLEANPDDSTELDVRFTRAVAALQLRGYAQARSDLERVVTLRPTHLAARLLLARVDELDGRPRQALERMNMLIEGEGRNWFEGRIARGELEERMQLYDLALADTEAALQLSPQSGKLHLMHGRLLLRLGKRHQALQAFELAKKNGIDPAEIRPLLR